MCSGVVTAKEQGVYLLETNTCLIAFVTPSLSGLEVGTYPIVEANNTVYKIKKCTSFKGCGHDTLPAP